jgi:hypothetical protein
MPEGDDHLNFNVLELKAGIRTIEGHSAKFIAVFDFSMIAKWSAGRGRIRPSDEAEVSLCGGGICESEELVFVGIHGVSEDRKRRTYRRVPAVVRLYPTNSVFHLGTERLDSVNTVPTLNKFIWRITDGELDDTLLRRRVNAGFLNGNSVNEVIQGTSEIMEAVRERETPSLQRGIGNQLLGEKTVAGTVRVSLGNNFVWLTAYPWENFLLQDAQMFFRPIAFRADTCEVESHNVRYDWPMKSKPESNSEFQKFDATVRQVLSVSKDELARREAEYQAERAGKPKRGPKPKTSVSGHASGDTG